MGKNGIRFELAGPQHPGDRFSDRGRSSLCVQFQECNQKMGTRKNGRRREDSHSNHSEHASTDMTPEKHGHPLDRNLKGIVFIISTVRPLAYEFLTVAGVIWNEEEIYPRSI